MRDAARQRFAVIGSGISGLSAAWLLSKRYDVVLYEREPRLGGHSNTVMADTSDGPTPVDTGFIVFNDWTYPNLIALFEHLGVATHASDMGFAVSADNGGFEYSGGTLGGLFGQPGNIVRPRFWRMIRDLHRFYSTMPEKLRMGELEDISLGAVLDRDGYAPSFQTDHLLPMAAAIWSGTVDGMREYPAAAFVRFFVNHGLFKYTGRPQWRSVIGGSKSYVSKISEGLDVRTSAAVRAIHRAPDGVTVTDQNGFDDRFDGVIMAAHADQTLSMMVDADNMERTILKPFSYQKNLAALHTDPKLMPIRRRVWSSWNYLARPRMHAKGPASSDDTGLCVTYWMNSLQDLSTRDDLFVTLNPITPPDQAHILGTYQYDHPLFDNTTDAAQRELWRLQGHRRTWYCGSYFGAGFHEDGLQSGLAAAEAAADVRRPWNVENESGRIHLGPAQDEAA